MILRDLDLNKLSRLASQQVDHVTCIECCKYYTVPTTASCGHTLCHTCWRGRRNCASCGKQIEKKNLKLNIPLQNLRDHVSTLSATFEDLFNIKLDEFLLDSPVEIIPEPNKNVKEWLASSQNQFSAPVTSSTQSTQDHIQTEQITSDIQVHTANKRLSNQREVIHIPREQDDWDKIEEMPDAEKNNGNQKNFVGPMDIEHFEFMMDDEEYSPGNPRRSSRQKDNKIGNNVDQDLSPQKSEDPNKDCEKKLLKVAKNWNNVKRMKKEFSKLNKQNRNKLNVSIEMCKKQNKEAPLIPTEKLCTIDDNTPEIITSTETLNNNDEIIEDSENVNKHITHINEITTRNAINTNKTNNHIANVNNNVSLPRVAFIKKSALQTKPLIIPDNIQIEADKPSSHINNNDIEITIKIGNTRTNICIQKKDNDVQLKINSDREVQTSLGNCSFNTKHTPSTNLEHNLDIPNTLSAPKVTVTEKSVSKKNTASADTTSARFEITESIEREMTKSLDFNEMKEKDINKKIQNVHQGVNESQRALGVVNKNQEDIDLDIFDGESMEIVSLQSTKNTRSAILNSIKTTKRKPLTNEKRERDDDLNCIPSSKKIKLTLNKSKMITENQNITDSNNVNYITSQNLPPIEKYISENVNNSVDNRPKQKPDDKYSENIFSILDNDTELKDNDKEQSDRCETANKSQTSDVDVMELCTPAEDHDSDKSVVEDTPQKTSFSKKKNTNVTMKTNSNMKKTENIQNNTDLEIINLSDTNGDSTKSKNITVLEKTPKMTLETPGTITKFVDKITYKSTPMARKSLNFNNENCDPELTCPSSHAAQIAQENAKFPTSFAQAQTTQENTVFPSSFVLAQTTQEKEFLSKAFERTLDEKCMSNNSKVIQYCLAGSMLSANEQAKVKYLCSERKWKYVEKYVKDLTHLVVGVDDGNKPQRSVKYMCALAGSKWIVSYKWIEKCLETKEIVDEAQFEALDCTGEPGPRRSRLAKRKLFTGISFFCMPPFSVLDVDTLKDILVSSGGSVVSEMRDARAGERPALLLAEPEHTQEDRFIYLAMELSVVPVNHEWVLNCLGSYTLDSIYELLLCPASLLPPVLSKWPPELISHDE